MNDRYASQWAAAAGETPPRPAFLKRLWMVLVRPEELFTALAANPAWFPVAAFTAVVVGISLALIPAEVFYGAVAEQATSPEQLGDLQEAPMILYKSLGVASGAVVVLVLPVIVSLVTSVLFIFMRGDRASFRQHLCVISHAGVILALGALLVTPLRIRSLNIEETLAVGDFFPFLDGFLYNVLNGLDLFTLWSTVVAGLGLSLLDERRRWGPTAAVLVAIVVVLAVIRAFFTS
ncbi:MAG: YIP1 family protein [Gemmatimonadota bacterium]|nr:YIP1 family protein [Gemmatimonadota bacterium]MDE2873210.1 YIP1 family protein [Gemmatimonadota bacterium]